MTAHRAAMGVVLAAAFLVAPAGLFVVQAIRSNANDVRDWVPAHYAETRDYQWFRTYFGGEDFVIVSWPGCVLDDPRLVELAARLRQRNDLREAKGELAPFRRVTTGGELLARIMDEPLHLEREEAITRLQGTLVGPDRETTCAIVTLNELGHGQLKPALAEITAATADIGLPVETTYLGGPPIVNAAIDQISSQSLVRLAGAAAAVGLVVAWLCFRTVRLTAVVFIVASYSAVLSLAIVPLFGVPLNAILVTMVPLVYVAAMSGAIHLANYYLDSLAEKKSRPVREAILHASLPLGLATATTAVGLLSLWYSDLAPIRLFGLFSAIGVGVALCLQLGLLPALLTLWPAAPGAIAAQENAEPDALSPAWRRLIEFVLGRHKLVAAACLVVLVVSMAGLLRVQTSIEVMRLVSPRTPLIAHYDWLESHLGALVPMEVVVRFPASDERGVMLRRLQLVRQVEESIKASPSVGGCLSAATFAPEPPTGASVGNLAQRVLINRRLMKARPRLTEAGYLAADSEEELWRISVRVASGDLDYGLFQQELRSRVEPILAEANVGDDSHASATFTGAVPIIYKARRSLLNGLALGFGTDVLLVVVAVIVMLRHWTNGLLLLLTSIFPMSLCFGAMGWFGVVVDIGSVMTPCVALGVTIDDVIHFVLWFRRGIAEGRSVRSAVELAYGGCGRAMVQSWGVIGLGLSAFAFSSFVPTLRFGLLMLGLLSIGLAGNLLFLPALLAGPLGRFIAARVPKDEHMPQQRAGGREPPELKRETAQAHLNSGS